MRTILIEPVVELTIVPEITIRILSSIIYYFYFSKYILNWIVFGLKRPVGSQVVILDIRCLVISSLLFYFFITKMSSVLEAV